MVKRVKIAFCTPGSVEHEDYKGKNLLGTESQVFGLVKELTKRGYKTFIIRRWYDNLKEENIDGIYIRNVNSPDLPDSPILKKIITKILFSKYTVKEIVRIKPDIIILTEIFSSYFLSNLKVPKIYVTHNPPTDLLPNTPTLKNYLKRLIEQRVLKNCKVVIALNKTIKEYLENAGYRVVCIPNAVELDNYSPSRSDGKYILFGGRLVKIKGLQYLIKAYSMLGKDLQKEYKLVMVGYGPEKKNLEKIALETGIKNRVEFVPWLSTNEFIKKISNCSIFVLPSLFECMPVALLEAMASGKPVIASDIPGPKDIIRHGYDGFLFEMGNFQELKRYLELVLGDPVLRRQIGKNGRKTVEETYTFKKVSERYVELFDELLG